MCCTRLRNTLFHIILPDKPNFAQAPFPYTASRLPANLPLFLQLFGSRLLYSAGADYQPALCVCITMFTSPTVNTASLPSSPTATRRRHLQPNGKRPTVTLLPPPCMCLMSFKDGLSRHSLSNDASQSSPLTPSSASSHSAPHLHTQQQHHHNMATSSPSKGSAAPDRDPVPIDRGSHLPHGTALIPRSALPESSSRNETSQVTFSCAVEGSGALDSNDLRDLMFPSSPVTPAEGTRTPTARSAVLPDLRRENASWNSTFGTEAAQDSSDGSVDIIIERHIIADDVNPTSSTSSTSPRKPLPAHWLPSHSSSGHKTPQSMNSAAGPQALPKGSPTNRNAAQATRSLRELGKGTSFLTKEALNAVDNNIALPTLRRTPSKAQVSSTKVSWNSPSVSPNAGSPRRKAGPPTNPSHSRATQSGSHVAASHRRNNSIISTGATSYHTAHGSPVRSPASSPDSFKSTIECFLAESSSKIVDNEADVTVEQNEDSGSMSRPVPFDTATGIRKRTSRAALSVSTAPRTSGFATEPATSSPLGTALNSPKANASRRKSPEDGQVGDLHLPTSTAQSSCIPRMSTSPGSSAHAPTLSSTLKQTKSAHTLRSPKTARDKVGSNSITVKSKYHETKSTRHVRTLDSTGSTPVQPDHKYRDISATTDTACITTLDARSTTYADAVGFSGPEFRDAAAQTAGLTESLLNSSTPSRTTSTSTVKAAQTSRGVSSANPVGVGMLSLLRITLV